MMPLLLDLVAETGDIERKIARQLRDDGTLKPKRRLTSDRVGLTCIFRHAHDSTKEKRVGPSRI